MADSSIGHFRLFPRLVSLAALALTLLCATSLPARAATPPARGGHRLLGVLGDPARFDRQTGQHSRVRLLIVGWGQGGTPEYYGRLLATMSEQPMLGLSAGPAGDEAISPGRIARGGGDSVLIAINRALATWGRPVYVRPLAEMNGYWNAYCAFNQDGASRGADHSTAAFRKAFARIYLIVHGGPAVNSRLAGLGLPPVDTRLAANPFVKVIWNPQGYGAPDLPANSAAAYYPGDRYVDVVGDDLYDIGGRAAWPAAQALYAAHPGKPFAFPEWGLWNLDDPGFVEQMAAFVRANPRTFLVEYYSGEPGSIFDLASKPRSLAQYRRLIAPLGR